MIRLVVLAFCLAAGLASAQSLRSVSETQSLTRSDPAAADIVDTISMSLANVVGFRVSVCAESTRTLTGGTLLAWVYNPEVSLWMRNPDLDLVVTNVAKRCRAFPDQRVSAKQGARVLYATSSVTVSAGTTVTVRIDGWTAP